ncbi:hypothetical protein E2C01_019468 [Portunus trituberculatus]|uniref:Uncharacterized protein n=1 Tax=Portunus trituberculatus TaxID=210409 RepID=A0A5B7DZH3_PORTR|nr:hypothetical protein [Portunus trituberculatus]
MCNFGEYVPLVSLYVFGVIEKDKCGCKMATFSRPHPPRLALPPPNDSLPPPRSRIHPPPYRSHICSHPLCIHARYKYCNSYKQRRHDRPSGQEAWDRSWDNGAAEG